MGLADQAGGNGVGYWNVVARAHAAPVPRDARENVLDVAETSVAARAHRAYGWSDAGELLFRNLNC